MKRAYVSLLVLPFLGGCVPNLARTNARIEQGFDFGVSAAAAIVPSGTDLSTNQSNNSDVLPMFEFDFQGGFRNKENFGFAGQLKIPTNGMGSYLDFYFELPSNHPWYYGVGGEVLGVMGLYGVLTHYFSEKKYGTLTLRYLDDWTQDSNIAEITSGGINPQLAFGMESSSIVEGGFFVGYTYYFGQGFLVDIDWFDNDPPEESWRHTILTGIFFRF